MPLLTFDAYQDRASRTAIYPRENALEYLALGLTSEAGEVAGKIKKYIRDGTLDEQVVAKEIGDVLWYAAELCSELGVSFGLVAQGNLDKLAGRQERGTLSGSGDER